MRVAGELKLDGDKIVLQQGGNATTITSNTPASDITLTLPATTDSLVGLATTDTLTNKTLTSPKINEDVVLTATATELNQLDGVTVGGTAAGDIVSIDGDQTLTGKTIVAADNTITTAASGNLASTELNAALAELQGSIDVRVLTTDFDAHVDDFDTHTGALAAHGASGAVVGTNNTQTLLNKTLTNPKINDTIALTATSTELNYVKNVTSAIQTQLDAKASTATLTSHTSATSAHGVTGDLVGTSDTQTLTNKTLTDPTLDAAAVFAELASAPSSPAAGYKKLFAKDDGKLYTVSSSGTVQEVGSGAGSGVKNYVSDSIDDWAASAGTVDDETVAANLPRASTTPIGLTFTSVSANDCAYTNFTLDEADEVAANLLLRLAAKVADASTWKVQLFAYSDAARTLDETEITLVDADSNGDWFLAATTADFTTFWTPNPSLPYMQLRIVDTVGGNTIYWSDTLVGPGDATSGAAVTDWEPYTPSSTQGFGTITACTLEWKQDGTDMLIRGGFTTGTVAATEAQIGLPDGYTVGGTSTNSEVVGDWLTNATTDDAYYVLATKGDSFLNVSRMDNAAAYIPLEPRSGSQIAVSSTRVSITARIPITEWVRSGTVNLINNATSFDSRKIGLTSLGGSGTPSQLGEYRAYYDTGTSAWSYGTAISSTSVGKASGTYGNMLAIGNSATVDGTVAHRIDVFIGKNLKGYQIHGFEDADMATACKIDPNAYSSTARYGLHHSYNASTGILSVSLSPADSTITSVNPALTLTGGSAVTTAYIYVTGSTVAVPGIGFNQATADTYGLVKAGAVPGITNGSSPAAGYVGETKSVDSTGGVTPTSGQYTDGGNPGITLTPGAWIVKIHCHYVVGSTSAVTDILYGLGTAAGNNGAGLSETARSYVTERPASHTPTGNFTRALTVFVNISETTTYYPKFRITGTIGSGQVDNSVDAIRLF